MIDTWPSLVASAGPSWRASRPVSAAHSSTPTSMRSNQPMPVAFTTVTYAPSSTGADDESSLAPSLGSASSTELHATSAIAIVPTRIPPASLLCFIGSLPCDLASPLPCRHQR